MPMNDIEVSARVYCCHCRKAHVYWTTIRAYLDMPGSGDIGIKYDPPADWAERHGSLYCCECSNELDD